MEVSDVYYITLKNYLDLYERLQTDDYYMNDRGCDVVRETLTNEIKKLKSLLVDVLV